MDYDYIERKPALYAPMQDNPSGLYCRDCRAAGMYHCAHPEECGGLRRMRLTGFYDNTAG